MPRPDIHDGQGKLKESGRVSICEHKSHQEQVQAVQADQDESMAPGLEEV